MTGERRVRGERSLSPKEKARLARLKADRLPRIENALLQKEFAHSTPEQNLAFARALLVDARARLDRLQKDGGVRHHGKFFAISATALARCEREVERLEKWVAAGAATSPVFASFSTLDPITRQTLIAGLAGDTKDLPDPTTAVEITDDDAKVSLKWPGGVGVISRRGNVLFLNAFVKRLEHALIPKPTKGREAESRELKHALTVVMKNPPRGVAPKDWTAEHVKRTLVLNALQEKMLFAHEQTDPVRIGKGRGSKKVTGIPAGGMPGYMWWLKHETLKCARKQLRDQAAEIEDPARRDLRPRDTDDLRARDRGLFCPKCGMRAVKRKRCQHGWLYTHREKQSGQTRSRECRVSETQRQKAMDVLTNMPQRRDRETGELKDREFEDKRPASRPDAELGEPEESSGSDIRMEELANAVHTFKPKELLVFLAEMPPQLFSFAVDLCERADVKLTAKLRQILDTDCDSAREISVATRIPEASVPVYGNAYPAKLPKATGGVFTRKTWKEEMQKALLEPSA